MNLFSLLIPKAEVSILYETDTLRQGLEKMRFHGYTALPVLSANGVFIGCVNEGDFLWHLLAHGGDMKAHEAFLVKDIVRPELDPAVHCNVTADELFERALDQNFIPVVDDRECFCGIITRRAILRALRNEQKKDSELSPEPALL